MDQSADYTSEDLFQAAGELTCGEFLERFPDEELIAALLYEDYEPPQAG